MNSKSLLLLCVLLLCRSDPSEWLPKLLPALLQTDALRLTDAEAPTQPPSPPLGEPKKQPPLSGIANEEIWQSILSYLAQSK